MHRTLAVAFIIVTLVIPFQAKADWLGVLGAILSDSTGNRSEKALDYLKREAGYRALETFLERKGISGAHYYIEAVKAAVEKDYSEAAVTLRIGLDESGLKLEAGVELLNAAAVFVRLSSPEVADKIEGLTQYVTNQ